MPNQNTPKKPQVPQPVAPVKQYDASDLWDAHALAESDLNWCIAAVTDLRNRINDIKKVFTACNQGYGIHFEQTQTLLDMYEYLIDNRLNHHKDEAEAYKTEWKAAETADNKKEVTL